jgi:Zn-dependent protease with chaperone function
MTQEEFTNLVHKFAEEANSHPVRHKFRVGFVALLGYIFVIGSPIVVVFLLAAVAATTRVLIAEVLFSSLIIPFFVVRALSVHVARPDGLFLRRSDSPELFRMIDEVSANLKAPRVDYVVLTVEFNASLLQRPRLGILGFHESYLVLGFPLLLAFSADQFRALIAHELGHLSGNHGRFGMWLYRMRLGSVRLQEMLQRRRGLLPAIYGKFFEWYRPYLDACSFVLSRRHEYACDLCASLVTSARTTAEMLVRLDGYGELWAIPYWGQVWAQVREGASPPPEVFAGLRTRFQQNNSLDQLSTFVSEAFDRVAAVDSTHPSLAERLTALGFDTKLGGDDFIAWLYPQTVNASDHFFPKSLPSISSKMDSLWIEKIKVIWRETHEKLRRSQQEMEGLLAKGNYQSLNLKERWSLITRISECKGMAEAAPMLRSFLDEAPEHGAACRLFGEYLLNGDDEAGIEYVERAIKIDPFFGPYGSRRIERFYNDRGIEEKASAWRKQQSEYREQVENAERERRRVSVRDKFHPHCQSPEQLDSLQRQLSQFTELNQMYLVRKDVKFLPEVPCYVAGCTSKRPWYLFKSRKIERALVSRLGNQVSWPFRTQILALDRPWRLRLAISRTKGATVFKR